MKKDADLFENGKNCKSNKLLGIFFAYYIAIFMPQLFPMSIALNVSIKAVILLIFLGYFLINYVNAKIPFNPLILTLIILILQIISLCYSLKFMDYNKYIGDNINILILPIYTFIFYGVLNDTAANKKETCKLFKWFIFFMAIACIYNIITNTKYILNFFSITYGYEYNLASFFDNRNTFAIYLAYAIIACVYVHRVEHKKYIHIFSILFLADLFFTLSRTSIISLAAFSLVYFYLVSKKNITLKLTIIIILFCAAAMLLSIDSISKFTYNILFRVQSGSAGRYELWQFGLDFYKNNNIFFGTGYGVGSSYLNAYAALKGFHNAYISILVTGGIALTAFYLLLIVYTLRVNLRIFKEDRVMGAFFIGVMTCYLISALTEDNFLLTSSGLSFWSSIFVLVLPKLYYNFLSQNKLAKGG